MRVLSDTSAWGHPKDGLFIANAFY